MKNVIISAYNLEIGGIETSLINLLENLDYTKYKVTLVLEEKKGIYLKRVPKKVNIIEYKVSNDKNQVIRKLKNMIKELKWVVKNFKKYDASISYATYSRPCGFIARTSSNNKILFVHGDYYLEYGRDIKKTKSFFDKIKIKKYSKIVFVSYESKNNISKIYPKIEKNFYVINNIINYKDIERKSNEYVDIEKNKKTFLFLGRLEEKSKKITRIIECAKRVKDADFWIVGDGLDKELYINKIREYKLDNVKMLGAKSNPYPYLKKTDYLLLTSDFEGFPVVYNEAIILSKPIIATINVTDDYISIPNRFGIIVDKNVDSIVKGIKDVLKKDFIIKEKVDYEILNRKRIKKIETLLEDN